VRALGRAYGDAIAEAGGARVAVGRDCRLHGVRIAAAFEAGVCEAGVDVVHLGMVPTPLVYFAIHDGRLDGGVAITGSHNPPDWNGFKLCQGTASMHGAAIDALRDRIIAGPAAAAPKPGERVEVDILPRYLERLKTSLRPLRRPVTVVVDAGNGAGGPAAVEVLRALGATVHPLYCEPDGRFPNHHPDPTVEANLADLKAAVAAHGADLGVALDGDADRLGAIDRHGRVVWGDQLLLYFATALLQEKPGARIVAEVKCSRVLFDGVRAAGGEAEMGRVGHSLIKARMKETGAALAGEMSGHLFFADRYYGYDDAIYAAARLVERVGRDGPALDAFVDACPRPSRPPSCAWPAPTPTSSRWSSAPRSTSARATRSSTSTACASTSPMAGASCARAIPNRCS
jgi:phosphomannomutase